MKPSPNFLQTACLLGLLAGTMSHAAVAGDFKTTPYSAGAHHAIIMAQHPGPDVTPLPPIYGSSDERGSLAETVSDAVMANRVRAAFTVHQELIDSDIEVDAENGVVTLSGSAISEAAKSQAIEVASGVDGVRGVDGEEVKVD